MASGIFEDYTHDPRDPAGRHEWMVVNMDLSIANALRRVILTDIPNMGFRGEEATADAPTGAPSVHISHNTGPLHNEIIAHRIGMLPIHFTAEEIAHGPGSKEADELQGNQPAVEIGWRFDLDVTAPAGNKVNVTTHDFQVYKDGVKLPHSETVRLFPVDSVTKSPILITRLRENERLALSAVPVLSTAREHAGFSPVSLCTYRFVVDPDAAANAANVLDKERAYFRNKRGDPTRIQFSMESEGALTPKNIMDMAFKVILGKLERVQASISNEEVAIEDGNYLTTRKSPNGPGFELLFKNEDDTLGNLFQSLIFNETIRKGDKQPAPALSYVGYCCPHPLDPTMVLRLVMDPETTDETAATPEAYKAMFSAHVDRIHGMITGLRAAWLEFAPK